MSTRWQNAAKCGRSAGLLTLAEADELFHPNTTPQGKYREADIQKAKEFCVSSGCTVRDQCLEFGLTEPHGIYAGFGPDERKGIRERRSRAKRAVSPPKFARSAHCPDPGRSRSVTRHLSLGEPLCLPCAEFDANQKLRKRQNRQEAAA